MGRQESADNTAHTLSRCPYLRGIRSWDKAGVLGQSLHFTAGSEYDSHLVSWLLDILQGTVVSARENS